MNQKIIEFFSASPSLYAESSKPFWDDEHISKSMLAAHLDVNGDGASRKISTIQKSVAWLCDYCQDVKGKQLLDLGCGPGLYAELLHDRGFSVTGIDFSKRSIEYARNHARQTNRKIQYEYKNYLEMNYDSVFDVAILVYYDFGVLSPQARNVLLTKICRALKRNGLLILDVLNAPYRNLFHEGQSIHYEKGGFWSPEPYVVVQENKLYHETSNTLERYLIITEHSYAFFNIWNQIYSQASFTEEITKQNFEPVAFFNDFCGTPFTGQEESICGVFRKK